MIPWPLAEVLAARKAQWQNAHEQLDLAIAQQYGIYHDDTAVEATGVRGILQMFLFAPDDATHVEQLLTLAGFPRGAHILDCGCGTGEMDALIRQHRPDLRLTLLNKSMAQLRCCPREQRIAGDMQWLPFADATFDAMLLCYTLGYGPIDTVFSEAACVVKPGGQLVLADMVCVAANQETGAEAILLLLGYKCYGGTRIDTVAAQYGFELVQRSTPTYLHPAVVHLWTEQEREILFHDIWPDVLVFQRKGNLSVVVQ